MTTTANAGAAPVATSDTPKSLPGTQGDTSSAAPTETTTPAESKPPSILERIRQQREEADKAKTTEAETGDADGADLQKNAEDNQPDVAEGVKDGDKDKDSDKTEPDSVPMAAFKARIGKLNGRIKELSEQVASKDLEVKRRDAAIDLLREEVIRLQKAAEAGTKLDPRDEQIRAYEFEKRVSALQQKLLEEHQTALAEQAEAIRVEELRSHVAAGFRRVLDKYPLVSGPELRAAARKVLGDAPKQSAEEIVATLEQIAARLDEQKLEKAKGRLQPSEKPPAPKFVKPSNGQAAGYQYPANDKGMAAWLRAYRQRTQST